MDKPEEVSLYGPWGWYQKSSHPFPYDDTDSYRIAGDHLSRDGATVEDWGGGTGWARRYIHGANYVLVDGSWSRWTDNHVDLRTYRTTVDRIMMRHVLEHNADWRKIAKNFTMSWTDKAALVLFVPFSETGEEWDQFDGTTDVPDLHLVREELEEIILVDDVQYAFQELNYPPEKTPDDTIQYRWEGIYLLNRP